MELKRVEQGIMPKASQHIMEGTLEPGNQRELLLRLENLVIVICHR